MNSWDRQPFLTDVATGEPSYTAAMSHVTNNFVIANYGSSQGFDTDDGSSYYNISDNFFFMADAWKMDYVSSESRTRNLLTPRAQPADPTRRLTLRISLQGGHDSIFSDNVVYHGHNDGQNCLNTWPFLPDHGALYQRNRCVLPKSSNLFGLIANCDCPGNKTAPPWTPGSPEPPKECGVDFGDNHYYTQDGTAQIGCKKPAADWAAWTGKYGNDPGSSLGALPSDDELLSWAREKLPTLGPSPPA
jgi:hypothetical protein